MIALAASNDGDSRPAPGPEDDGSGAVVVMTPTDASLPIAPPPMDAAYEPTVPADAANL
jgi:hypothetical protein